VELRKKGRVGQQKKKEFSLKTWWPDKETTSLGTKQTESTNALQQKFPQFKEKKGIAERGGEARSKSLERGKKKKKKDANGRKDQKKKHVGGKKLGTLASWWPFMQNLGDKGPFEKGEGGVSSLSSGPEEEKTPGVQKKKETPKAAF